MIAFNFTLRFDAELKIVLKSLVLLHSKLPLPPATLRLASEHTFLSPVITSGGVLSSTFTSKLSLIKQPFLLVMVTLYFVDCVPTNLGLEGLERSKPEVGAHVYLLVVSTFANISNEVPVHSSTVLLARGEIGKLPPFLQLFPL